MVQQQDTGAYVAVQHAETGTAFTTPPPPMKPTCPGAPGRKRAETVRKKLKM